jgi:uncharacterized SAM-binding protein YcdF (DUF218 family)
LGAPGRQDGIRSQCEWCSFAIAALHILTAVLQVEKSMSHVAFYGSKILQELLYPYNLVLLLMAIAWLFLRRNCIRAAQRALVAAFLLLAVPGTGYVNHLLLKPLESAYPTRLAADCPTADVIVVLGGTTAQLAPPRLEAEEIRGARLQMAARLYHAGKAPIVVVSGGPYPVLNGEYRSEADDMRDVLIAFGVPDRAIRVERDSRNTYENVLFTKRVLGDKPGAKALLVTSAFHMPRAVALFQKQGVEVEPAPCGHLTLGKPGVLSGLRPELGQLSRSELAIKEYVGRLVYWLFGRA